MFELSWVRFSTSGTLITCLWLAERLAPRAARARTLPRSPGWVRALIVISVLGFYALIGPTGGALLGGAGNAVGIALALLSLVLVARQWGAVRYPGLAGRSLFYLALPLAVGVPWGLLVLSVPAVLTSIWCCRRADRLGNETAGDLGWVGARPRHRMIPGIW